MSDSIEIPVELFRRLADLRPGEVETRGDLRDELAAYGITELVENRTLDETFTEFGESMVLVVRDGYGGFWRTEYWLDWTFGAAPGARRTTVRFRRCERRTVETYEYRAIGD